MWKLPCDSLLPEQARSVHPSAAFPWRRWERLWSRCFPSARREWALAPVSQMLLFRLLLLTSALAGQPGTQAESNPSSKFQLSSTKEQNGESRPPRSPSSSLAVCVLRLAIARRRVMYPGLRGCLRAVSPGRCAPRPGPWAFGGDVPVCNVGSCHQALIGQPQCHCRPSERGPSASELERQFKRTLQDLSLPVISSRSASKHECTMNESWHVWLYSDFKILFGRGCFRKRIRCI